MLLEEQSNTHFAIQIKWHQDQQGVSQWTLVKRFDCLLHSDQWDVAVFACTTLPANDTGEQKAWRAMNCTESRSAAGGTPFLMPGPPSHLLSCTINLLFNTIKKQGILVTWRKKYHAHTKLPFHGTWIWRQNQQAEGRQFTSDKEKAVMQSSLCLPILNSVSLCKAAATLPGMDLLFPCWVLTLTYHSAWQLWQPRGFSDEYETAFFPFTAAYVDKNK